MIFNLNSGSPNAILNFKIVGGTVPPENPKDNIIWVETSREITSWIISPNQPESPTDGLVWIKNGNSSSSPFNALKKNAIQIYPISAKHYIDGAWSEVPIQASSNGAFGTCNPVAFWAFKTGVGLGEGITGFSNMTCTTQKIYCSGLDRGATNFSSNENIDVSDYKKAHFTGVTASWIVGEPNTTGADLYVGDKTVNIGHTISQDTTEYPVSGGNFTIDISDIDGEVTFGIKAYTNANYVAWSFEVLNIWFE